MQNQLKKAINLAKKTGDKLIVFDEISSENPYVVMSMDEYEKIIIDKSEVRDLTENELLDKINRDIAIWKSEQNFEDKLDNVGNDIKSEIVNISDKNEINEVSEDVQITNFITNEIKKENKSKNNWKIPNERKLNAEEIIDEDKMDSDEDRQYLEEITF